MIQFAGLLGLAGLFVAAPFAAQAQNAADPAEWALDFVGRTTKSVDQAFLDFKAETYLGQNVATATETLRDAYGKNLKSFGPIHQYEVISQQSIGPRLRRVTVGVYHAKQPQILLMDFYQQTSINGWYLLSMKIDTNLQNMPWPPVMPATPR